MGFKYWTAPWWWAEVRNSESPEQAASVFAFVTVCLSVCYQATGHSFWPSNLIFGIYVLYGFRKNVFFHFSTFSSSASLGPFFTFFPLCIGHKSPHSTYKIFFWHVGSLCNRKRTIFFNENVLFWLFEGHFWQIYRFFHLLYIVFGIGT